MSKRRFNFRHFTAAGVILCLSIFAACDDSVDDEPPFIYPQTPIVTNNTFVEFKNLEQYPVTIYGDPGRNVLITDVEANGTKTVEAVPAPAGTAFYPTFHLDIFDIPGVSIPYNGESIVALVEADKTTSVPIPKLKSIEINSAYIKIINNSSYSLALRQGSGEKSPLGGGSTVINSGQNAAYDVFPGSVSNYSIYSNTTTPAAFPAGLTEFKPGIIYVITYNGTSLSLTDSVSLLQTIPPTVPENVRAEALSKDSARIAWNDAYGATSYRIFRAEGSPDASYSQVANIATRSWTDTGLTAGEIYYYKVSASSGENRESGQSAAVSAFMMAAGNVWVNAVTDNSVSLAWNSVSGATSYNVYRSNSENGNYSKVNTVAITGTTFTDTGLAAFTAYYYKISPVANGAEGMQSNPVSGTTLMAAPSSVRINAVTDSTISLTWEAANGVTGYNVYRSSSENGIYSKLNIAAVTETVFINTGLNVSTTYYYKITAVKGDNESVKSNTVSGITLMSAPGNVQVNSVTDNSISLAWNAVSGASGYNVYRSVSENGIYTKANTNTVTGTSFTDTVLAAFTVYYYKVSPVSGGAEGMQSNAVSGTTLMAAPSNVRISAVTGTTISLAWDTVNGASSYNIYRSASENGTYSKVNSTTVTGTTFTDPGLNASTTYYYRITAVKGDNEGVRSNAISGVTFMSAPGNVRVSSVTDNSISLAWNAVSGAGGYNVYRSVSENGTYTKANANTVTGTSFTDIGLNAFTVYYYKVSPVSGGSEGIQSSPVSGTTLLAAPLNVRISSVSGSSIGLAWDTVNGANGYNIYRSASENGTYSKVNSTTVTGTTFTNTGLAVLTTYYYRICAVTGNNEGVRSNAVSGTTLSLRISTVTINSVGLAWSAVNGTSSYNIYRSESEDGPYAKINTSTITGTTFTDTNVSPYTIIYYYKISAVTGGIEGSQSDHVASVVWVPGNGLAEKLAWLQNSAANYILYFVEVDTDEYIGPHTLSYGKSGVGIILSGKVMYTVNLSSQGSLFNVGSGVTLILNNNITLKGISDNNNSLVYINGGSLLMSGGEISGNTASSNSGYVFGGGVYVLSGTFTMNGGEISGNTARVVSSGGIGYGGGVYVNGNNARFTMNGGKISGNSGTGSGVCVNGSNATFTMNNGEISGNGVLIYNGGTFTMNNGEISGNTGSGVSLADSDSIFTMSGGKIFDNIASDGGGVSVSNGIFTMSGGEIFGNIGSNSGFGSGGVIISSGTFNMSGGKIFDNTSANAGGGVGVTSSGTFTMNGGEIFDNTAINGGGVSASGTFNMRKGKISNNIAPSGGGVFVNYGTFTMDNGEISDNTSSGGMGGGGVYVFRNSTFTMNGGVISGNTTTTSSSWGYGGGVFVEGTFTMSGGNISNNSTPQEGGGVYVHYDFGGATFTMSDGEISGNISASKGGGVSVSGSFTMTGGRISSNTTSNGGGVSVNGAFTMTGGIIYGNNATIDFKNTATNGSALYKYDFPGTTAEYGRFVGTSYSYRGDLDTTDTTIRIVNGNLQTN